MHNKYHCRFLTHNVKTIVQPRCMETISRNSKLPVHLIQQYYIPDDTTRQEEVSQCLRVNLENDSIHKIHMLTEGASYPELMASRKIVHKNIGKRLTYLDAFQYINTFSEECLVIISNADICFDSSLVCLQTMDFMEGKACQALLRWEYATKVLFGPRPDSQDSWIFHHRPGNPIIPDRYIQYLNFELGRPGCDNKLIWCLQLMSFHIFNEPKRIQSWHVHRSPIRNYNMSVVKGPYGLVEPLL